MTFRPKVGDQIKVDEQVLYFEPNPASRMSMVYKQEGRKGTVYQLLDRRSGQKYALKIFIPAYRNAEVVQSAQAFKRYQKYPGLRVCNRKVLARMTHRNLIEAMPDLEYAVLMPWIEGDTWRDIVFTKQAVTPALSHNLASGMAMVLSELENFGLAHCDIAGTNTIVQTDPVKIELVDIEDMYAHDLPPPSGLPAGTEGYAFKNGRNGSLWNAKGDRFAGAIILTEMLIWCDVDARRESNGEAFFSEGEFGKKSKRFNLAKGILQRNYGAGVVDSFEKAWFAKDLSECRSMAQWWDLTKHLGPPQPLVSTPVQSEDLPPVSPWPWQRVRPGLQIRSHKKPTLVRHEGYAPSRLELVILLLGLPILALFLFIGLTPSLLKDPTIRTLWDQFPIVALIAPLFYVVYRKTWLTLAGYATTIAIGGMVVYAQTGRFTPERVGTLIAGAILAGLFIEGLLFLLDRYTNAGETRRNEMLALSGVATVSTIFLDFMVLGYLPWKGIWIAPLLGALGWALGDLVLGVFISRREAGPRDKKPA
ncbi:hypothetical protein [Petrachloros mirabilis]